MRRHHPPYDLAPMQARVIERLEAGMTIKGVVQLPGFPSKHTLYRWGWEDEAFAQRIARAQAWGRWVRRQNRNAADLYDEAKARAFLIRVRLGGPIRRMKTRPEFARRIAMAQDWRDDQKAEARLDRILSSLPPRATQD